MTMFENHTEFMKLAGIDILRINSTYYLWFTSSDSEVQVNTII